MGISYHITEPHPSVPQASTTIYYGRGGAGNRTRINHSTITPGPTASGPASRIQLTPPPSNALFTSGRGGAGNVHREKERAMFSFDEELAQQERLREHAAPVFHIGRGGAGNFTNGSSSSPSYAFGRDRRSSSEERRTRIGRTNSNSSTGSATSDASASSEAAGGMRRSIEGAWNKVSRGFSR